MKIIVYGKGKKTTELHNKITLSLDELGLSEFIELEKTNSEKIKEKLNISKKPALIVEEENIDFIDTIFEGIVPNDEEIKGMIISIIGGKGETPSCASDSCGMTCMY